MSSTHIFRQNHWYCIKETKGEAIDMLFKLDDKVLGNRIKEKLKVVLSNCISCTISFYDVVDQIKDSSVRELLRDLELRRCLPILRNSDPLDLATCFIAIFRDPLWVNQPFIQKFKELNILNKAVDNFPLNPKFLNGISFMLLLPDKYCKSFGMRYISKFKDLNADEFIENTDKYFKYMISVLDSKSSSLPGIFKLDTAPDNIISCLYSMLSILNTAALKTVVDSYKLDTFLSKLPNSRSLSKIMEFLYSASFTTIDISTLLNTIANTNIPEHEQSDYTNEFFTDLDLYSSISSDKIAAFLNNPHIKGNFKTMLSDKLYSKLVEEIESTSFSQSFYSDSLYILNNSPFSQNQYSLLMKCLGIVKECISVIFTGGKVSKERVAVVETVLSSFSFELVYKNASLEQQKIILSCLKDIYIYPTIRKHSLSKLQLHCNILIKKAISNLDPTIDGSQLSSIGDTLIGLSFFNELVGNVAYLFRYSESGIESNELNLIYKSNSAKFLNCLTDFFNSTYKLLNQGHYYADVLLNCSGIFEFCTDLFLQVDGSEILLNVHILHLNLLAGLLNMTKLFFPVSNLPMQQELKSLIEFVKQQIINLAGIYVQNTDSWQSSVTSLYSKFYSPLYLIETVYPVADSELREVLKTKVLGYKNCMEFITNNDENTSEAVLYQLPDIYNSDRTPVNDVINRNAVKTHAHEERQEMVELSSDSSVNEHLVPFKREAKYVDTDNIVKRYKPDYSVKMVKPEPHHSFNSIKTPELALSTLLKQVLAWDISKNTILPSYKSLFTNLTFDEPVQVPSKFKDINEYHDIYQPLIYYELYESIQQCKEEDGEYFVHFSTKVEYIESIDDFSIITCELDESARVLLENDVVAIQILNTNDEFKEYLGFVENSNFFKNKLKVRIKAHEKLVQRTCNIDTKLNLTKIYSCTTSIREFNAFGKSAKFPLINDILNAVIRPIKYNDRQLSKLQAICSAHKLNKPQSTAVINSVSRAKGFSLIQGPPGTGKTMTISSIINCFLLHPPSKGNRINAPGSTMGSIKMNGTVLVCAPSNAAIDVIIKRLLPGLYDSNGKKIYPLIVRLGVVDQISKDLQHVSLDSILNSRIEDKASSMIEDNEKLLTNKMAILQAIPAVNRTSLEKSEILKYKHQIDKLKSKRQKSVSNEDSKQKIRNEILKEANIVCCTLTGSGHDFLKKSGVVWKYVVIDEAAQSVELSSLIPLQHGCENCVLVGDHKQLPPTVISRIAKDYNYEQSLFDRLYNQNTDKSELLSVQYRMHPDISRFPSKLFYGNKITDGVDLVKWTKEWHNNRYLGPFRFFDIKGSHNNHNKSLSNAKEAAAVVDLIKYIAYTYPEINVLLLHLVQR
eukprot:NODE_76_length_23341_cov_0.477498.p2 type:complete len:1357 gc:universal NODE_76_length_23341_cov_0.477498:22584-18514(-)